MQFRGYRNPFYVLVVLSGLLFCVTACAYGVLTVRELHPDTTPVGADSGGNLLRWLDRNGPWTLGAELALLAVATVAAMGTDNYWEKRK